MKLSAITLETEFFEDYLSFLTEVLELDMEELTSISMTLKLSNTFLEIKKIPCTPHLVASKLEFTLDDEEFEALTQKLNFFYYRRGPNRFLLLGVNKGSCELTDPDGRVWRFKNVLPKQTELSL